MSTQLAEGNKAPDFTLPADGGAEVSLASFSGQNLVLYFYPKDDTSGCTAEAIAFTALLDEFAQANTRIVGISKDSVAKHDKFKAKHELGVTLGADEELGTIQAYGVWMEKSMYGRKYMGIERATFLVDGNGKIAKIWRKVKVKGHADAVLKAARELNG